MIRYFKLVIFLACLGPLAYLLWGFFGRTPFDMTTWGAGLGANPIEKITHTTGDWTLWFLLITLSITPARKLLRMPSLIKFRRMLGLFAFFYGCLHFLTYIWLDKFFDIHEMLADIAKRKFITIGLTALLLMVPLAITSTSGWIRRLGGKRWQRIHRLIYFAAIAGVIHYLWLVKADIRKPLEDAIVLGMLLAFRVAVWAAAALRKPPRFATVAPRPVAE
ncbi:MAG TPA: protein-methionine-sulfoxide reductase heme-binding subunit MsrQ [Terriglobales bacterium]|jgi:sulfoxide reductase heme-binding subunit YedZ|nr:protein-methionine-sulfoxide reductase heme-binding subunit MsrQ [Terriglobales bacterium]